MRGEWRAGRWRGVPLYFHWTVLLGLPWLYYRTHSFEATLLSFAAYTALLLLHELGHAAAAKWRGAEVHSIRLLFIHGECRHEEPYYEKDDVIIAWGGVAAQLAVLVVALVAGKLMLAIAFAAYYKASSIFGVFIEINILTMAVNLIPVAPLDGAKA